MLPTDHSRLKHNWRYTLETLTPLHIGAGGDPLVKDTDFIVTSRDVVVLDSTRTFERIYQRALEAPASAPTVVADVPLNPIAAALQQAGLLDAEVDKQEAAPSNSEAAVLTRLAQGMTPQQALEAGWLTADDLQGPEKIVRYRLKPPSGVGAPLPERLEPPQILPFSKTAGQPYVPGSSLKGALRTVLAEVLFSHWPQPLTLQDVQSRGRPNPKAADDTVENQMFGRDPNHDWLRALHVGDSAAASSGLALAVAGTYSLRGQGLQLKEGMYAALEVLPVGATAQGVIRVDRTLFTPVAAARLGFGPQEGWLRGLIGPVNTHARTLTAAEIAFYREHRIPEVVQFYEDLQQRMTHLAANQCLVQMSWGTGWRAKTLGPSLEAQEAFPAIRDQFRLGYPNAPFPKTRRLTLTGAGYTRPGVPLGWMLLTLDPAT
jgi:CRISPR-associated protein Csm5